MARQKKPVHRVQMTEEKRNYREYPKDCVNFQTDVRYNYSVWRFILWQGKKIHHKKQHSER
jgi:hypothetical protein